jgi:superfamily I DNA/RNA helicase
MAGPVRITGSLGSGVTTALAERADAASGDVLVLCASVEAAARWPGSQSATTFLDLALELLGRRLVSDDERLSLIASLTDEVEEVVATILRYQSSFLGREELLVHAEAAGELDRWDELDRIAQHYLALLDERQAVDEAGALVAASMRLRERDHHLEHDAVVVDDWQQATFATNRLLTQLAGGPGANVVVGGHPRATVSSVDGASAKHLESFLRRFGGGEDVELDTANRRRPTDPELVVVDDQAAALRSLGDDIVVLVPRRELLGLHPSARLIESSVGLEWPVVVIAGCTEGVFPGPPPAWRLYDPYLLGGPDVPTPEQRIEAAAGEERRRFALACTRATERLVFIAAEPVSPFVSDLLT